MAITGTSTTCNILANTPFQTSGLTEVNLSTINIVDDNGLDVSECFGITTDIITVQGTNVTLTGECDTSLEIQITQGIGTEVVCEYIDFEIQRNGVIIFELPDGSTTTNIHPDCCEALGYISEIGPEMWYICRVNNTGNPTDCDNYTPNGAILDGYIEFDIASGGTTTIVPSVECCYQYGYVESISRNGTIRCVVEQPNPCEGYEVIEPVPLAGPIPFTDPNGNETVNVPSSQCCTALGYNFIDNQDGTYTCFQNSNEQPTVSFTNDSCCDPT